METGTEKNNYEMNLFGHAKMLDLYDRVTLCTVLGSWWYWLSTCKSLATIRWPPCYGISIRNHQTKPSCENRHFFLSRPPGLDCTKHRDTFWSCKSGNSDDRFPAANCNDGHSQDGKKFQWKREKLTMICLGYKNNNIWLDFEASPVQIQCGIINSGILRTFCLRLVDMQLTKARLVIYAYL